MIEIGELVGRGRTSDVYAYGRDSVVKVPSAQTPDAWPVFEAELGAGVAALGLPVPQVRELVDVRGRPAVVFERISGLSMWQQVIADPSTASTCGRELARLHRQVLRAGVPRGVPDLMDRLGRKVAAAAALSEPERRQAQSIIAELPRGAALLHGDLHPGNVLMSPAGPMLIDWFDASVGHPAADLVRTSILLPPSVEARPRHLPGAAPGALGAMRDAYLQEMQPELDQVAEHLGSWRAVVAAGRLSEKAEADDSAMLELWRQRPSVAPPAAPDPTSPAAAVSPTH